jgi:hypothetical protein
MNEERDLFPLFLAIAGTMLVVGVLTVVFWEFVSDNIILPIYSMVILIDYALGSVPQLLYLVLVLLVFIGVAIYRLVVTFQTQKDSAYVSEKRYGGSMTSRYDYWNRICGNLHRSHFAHEELMRSSRKFILDLLANQQHCDVYEIERMVLADELDLPAHIQALLLDRRFKSNLPRRSFFRELFYRIRLIFRPEEYSYFAATEAIEAEVDAVLTFIEQRLEISYNE